MKNIKKIFKLNITDKNLEKYCKKNFQEIDTSNPQEYILGLSYYYAIKKGLKDYQARSFASELTAFLTEQIIDTNVALIYNEARLDSFLYNKFLKCPSISEFIEYMVNFYKSQFSWKYERVGKYMQFKISKEEKQMFQSLPAGKQVDRFNWLLKVYDYTVQNPFYIRKGEVNSVFSINLGTSQYEWLMAVEGNSKTEKFLNLLYYGYELNRNSF